jgi:hypothetical protein
MSNTVGLILSAALIIDTIANLLRLRGVQKAIKQQDEMIRKSNIEAEKRIDAAANVVESVVRMTVAEMLESKR